MGAAVACYGAPISQKHRLLANKISVRNTFLEDAFVESEDASPRALSVGASPRSPCLFSLGSRQHNAKDPGACSICQVHHRHLLDATKPPCKYGIECTRCHMPHTEQGWRPARRNRC